MTDTPPAMHQHQHQHQRPTEAEEDVISAARIAREQCLCGEVHDGIGITPAMVARLKGYLAANPGQQFAYDDEAEIVALIIPHDEPEPPEILARADCLASLLDSIGAPSAQELS